jgi:hypothetical protein
LVIGENLVLGDLEILDEGFHSLTVVMADTDDFDIRMLVSHAQVVAHVHVVEIDSGDFPFFHLAFLIHAGLKTGANVESTLKRARIRNRYADRHSRESGNPGLEPTRSLIRSIGSPAPSKTVV